MSGRRQFRGLRTAAAGFAVLAAVAIPAVAPAPAGASPGDGITLSIDVDVVERFGFDADADGLIDLPNTAAYVHGLGEGGCEAGCGQARFPVILRASLAGDGTALAGIASLPIFRYDWRIHGVDLLEEVTGSGSVLLTRLPEGEHWVELAVTPVLPWGSVGIRTGRSLVVDDVLVAAVGDSYASGEGNPERHRLEAGGEAQWADGAGDPGVEAAHEAAHRSSVAWPVRVALALEAADEATSVTFVTVAASSARVAEGLLGPQSGVASTGQIEQLEALVGERVVDLLLVSVGGNDVGFSRIVRELVDADPLFDPICYSTDLQNVWEAARDGDWTRSSSIVPGLPFGLECRSTRSGDGPRLPGLDGLGAELDRLAAAIDGRLRVQRVVLAEYPDPTGRQRTGGPDLCGEIVGDAFPAFRFLEIDAAEQTEGRHRVIGPLNAELAAAAARNGWTFAGGVADAFTDGHGYCAEWPDYGYPDEYLETASLLRDRLDFPEGWYRNPGGDLPAVDRADRVTSWFRTAAQSAALQGPDTRYETSGTLHPNELGHAAIAVRVLEALR